MAVIADNRICPQALSFLKAEGFEPILIPAANYLQEGVASHTDMLIFIGFGKVFCHENYYKINREIINKIASFANSEVCISSEPTGKKYPLDVLFNAALVGKRLICNEKTVSKLILTAASEQGCEIINVPQGYTKCSIAPVSANAIITADKAIAEACRNKGIDVLTVSEGHVSLPPYNFGFIGGACGLYRDNVYFCGSIDNHPDGESIKEFCVKHKKSAVSLSDGELQDVGSLFFI